MRGDRRAGWASPLRCLALVLCLTAAMSYGTITESFYFKDNLTFYAYNLTRAPHNPYAESNYASLLAEGGQYGPAVEAFLDVVNYNPDYWTPTYNLALTYYKMGKLPEAETYFLQAIRINPNKSDAYFYLGMTCFKSGRTAEGIACVRQAIAIRPNGYVYHFALGVMLKTQGDMAGALQEFKEELANNPEEKAAAAQMKEIESQLRARNRAPVRHLAGRTAPLTYGKGVSPADARGPCLIARRFQRRSFRHIGLRI